MVANSFYLECTTFQKGDKKKIPALHMLQYPFPLNYIWPQYTKSKEVAKWLALLIVDHKVTYLKTTGGAIHLGPVVQSFVSLTSLLKVISLTVLADSIYNFMIFFAKKMWVAFALQKLLTFFQQKISAYLRITWLKF